MLFSLWWVRDEGDRIFRSRAVTQSRTASRAHCQNRSPTSPDRSCVCCYSFAVAGLKRAKGAPQARIVVGLPLTSFGPANEDLTVVPPVSSLRRWLERGTTSLVEIIPYLPNSRKLRNRGPVQNLDCGPPEKRPRRLRTIRLRSGQACGSSGNVRGLGSRLGLIAGQR